MSKNDVSPGGSPILRHRPHDKKLVARTPGSTARVEIQRHFARFFGEPTTVFREAIAHFVNLEVCFIPPHAGRDCFTLFTTGMSDLPMNVPEGYEGFQYAELIISLPPYWNVEALMATRRPDKLKQWLWPIRWLKDLARMPHECDTWLAYGHTVPNDDPPQPLSPETKLCGWMTLPPTRVPKIARSVRTTDGRRIHLYSLHALHIEEMSLKLNKGLNPLLDAFDREGVSEVLDIHRRPCVRETPFRVLR
jgi:hypothetical protein